jgi:hypothetical protein
VSGGRSIEKIDAELVAVQDAKRAFEAALLALAPLGYPLSYPARVRRDIADAIKTFDGRIAFCLREKDGVRS